MWIPYCGPRQPTDSGATDAAFFTCKLSAIVDRDLDLACFWLVVSSIISAWNRRKLYLLA